MEENREFSISYSELIQKADHFIKLANRDQVELNGYGMENTLPDDTQTLREQFADLPTDEEMLTDAKTKNSAFDQLIDKREDIENERVAATAMRAQIANSLYRKIVEISRYGKSAYTGKDNVRMAEYVLTD